VKFQCGQIITIIIGIWENLNQTLILNSCWVNECGKKKLWKYSAFTTCIYYWAICLNHNFPELPTLSFRKIQISYSRLQIYKIFSLSVQFSLFFSHYTLGTLANISVPQTLQACFWLDRFSLNTLHSCHQIFAYMSLFWLTT
jgi:hypothetical protein